MVDRQPINVLMFFLHALSTSGSISERGVLPISRPAASPDQPKRIRLAPYDEENLDHHETTKS